MRGLDICNVYLDTAHSNEKLCIIASPEFKDMYKDTCLVIDTRPWMGQELLGTHNGMVVSFDVLKDIYIWISTHPELTPDVWWRLYPDGGTYEYVVAIYIDDLYSHCNTHKIEPSRQCTSSLSI